MRRRNRRIEIDAQFYIPSQCEAQFYIQKYGVAIVETSWRRKYQSVGWYKYIWGLVLLPAIWKESKTKRVLVV
jgi:hypothetical protein